MKKQIISTWLFLVICSTITIAQSSAEAFTYAEFKGGYGITAFGTGLNQRFNAGNFSPSGGGLASLAAYRKFNNISYLNVGIKFKSLGAAPSVGDSGEEMFFNFWGSAITTKYFPFQKAANKGLFLTADYFFVTQFTQKYRDTEAMVFEHQFAIGNALTFGIGYDFPIGNIGGIIGAEYEMASRQGEVTGVGDQQFRNTNLAFLVGIRF